MSFKGLSSEDPLGLIVTIAMMFIMVFWFGQTSTAVNAIGGNSTIVANFCCASTSAYGATSWLLWIVFSPFALLIFINYFAHRVQDQGDERVDLDSQIEGSSEGENHGITGMADRLHSQRMARRRHHSLSEVFEGLEDEDTT